MYIPPTEQLLKCKRNCFMYSALFTFMSAMEIFMEFQATYLKTNPGTLSMAICKQSFIFLKL